MVSIPQSVRGFQTPADVLKRASLPAPSPVPSLSNQTTAEDDTPHILPYRTRAISSSKRPLRSRRDQALVRMKLCGKWTRIQSNKATKQSRATTILCGLWSCDFCAGRLRSQWMERLRKAEVRTGVRCRLNGEAWKITAQRLHRYAPDAEYITIRHNGETYIFFEKTMLLSQVETWLKGEVVDYWRHSQGWMGWGPILQGALQRESDPTCHKHKVSVTEGYRTKTKISQDPGTLRPKPRAFETAVVELTLEKVVELAEKAGGKAQWVSDFEVQINHWVPPAEWGHRTQPARPVGSPTT